MWHLHPAHVTTSHDVTILTSESVVCITQCLFVWRQNWPELMNTSLNAHINTRHKGRAGQLESDFAYNQLWYEEANFRCIVCINMRPGLRVGWGRVGLKQLSPGLPRHHELSSHQWPHSWPGWNAPVSDLRECWCQEPHPWHWHHLVSVHIGRTWGIRSTHTFKELNWAVL